MILEQTLIQEYQDNGVVLLRNVISSDWLEQLAIGIEKNFKDLTPKDKTAIAVHMKSTIENYIKPNDQDLYHFGKNLHLSGNEIAAYTGGTVVATAALFYLVPAAIGTAFWTSLSTAARIALTSAVQALRSKGALKFATQAVKNVYINTE